MPRAKQTPPGDAEKPEGTPGAKDGEPNENELERRRQAKQAGTSLAERGAPEEPEEEMFPLGTVTGDPKVSHKNLIKAGAAVTVKAKLTTEAVPLVGGGLFDPEVETSFLVRALPGKVQQVPKHEDRGGKQVVKEWDLVQELRAVHVQGAEEMYTREQVLELFHAAGVASATISKVLGEGPVAAGTSA